MMEFTACYLNYVRREMERKKDPRQVGDLQTLAQFIEEQGIMGSVRTDHMIDVPEYIRRIIEVPEDAKA